MGDVVIYRLVELYYLSDRSPCPREVIKKMLEPYELKFKEVYHMYSEVGTEIDEYNFDEYLAKKMIEASESSPLFVSFDMLADIGDVEDYIYEFFGEIAKRENKTFIVAYDPYELVVVEVVVDEQ